MRMIPVLTCAAALFGGAAGALAQTPPPTLPPPAQQQQQPPPPAQTPPPLPVPQTAKPAPAPFPPDAKIAFISMQTIVSESQLGKAGQKQMQVLQDKKTQELAQQNNQIAALQKEIQQQSGVLSASAIAAKSAQLDKLQRDFQFAQQNAAAERDSLNEQLLADFTEKVLPVVEEIRQAHDLWAVFSIQDSGVAAAHPGLDLSDEVIKKLDEKTKAGGGGALDRR